MKTTSSMEENERELTYGERAVGLTFNPANDPLVQEVKEHYAKIIDIADAIRKAEGMPSERGRLASVAITEAQGAQMFLVKAVTYKD